jgi:predicted GTPase
VKICAVPTQQNWRKQMKRKKTKRKQQGCDVAKVIDTVEQAVSTAKKVYRAIEPVVNPFTNRRK